MATVLVVDDEPASLRALQRALADEGAVLTASGGQQALSVLAQQPVAMLIADQRMPGMLGTELLAACAVRAPEVMRVLLTGYTDVDTLVEAINAGHVYAYVTKPWEPRELRLVVRRGLQHHAVAAERRRLMHELERAYTQARREADQKARLLALAAHELGTPLHVLSNALELLAAATVPPPARDWLQVARRNVTWLGRGLAQLSRGARARPERLRLHTRPVDLGVVLQNACGSCMTELEDRHLQVDLDVGADLPPVDMDPVWGGRALVNLISNAIRFTPDGGRVAVTARSVAGAVEVLVADSGIGIEPGVLDEIFEPFSAAGGDLLLHTSGGLGFGSRGLGLGLAIAKAVIEQHGGQIAVESQVGHGSRFTCRWPVARRGSAGGRERDAGTDEPAGYSR